MTTYKADSLIIGNDIVKDTISAYNDYSSMSLTQGSVTNPQSTNRVRAVGIDLYKGLVITAHDGWQFAAYTEDGKAYANIGRHGYFFSNMTFTDEYDNATIMVKRSDDSDISAADYNLGEILTLDYSSVDLYWDPADMGAYRMQQGNIADDTLTNRVKTAQSPVYQSVRIVANPGYLFALYMYNHLITPAGQQFVSDYTYTGATMARGVIVVRREDDGDIDPATDGLTLSDYVTVTYDNVYSPHTTLTHVLDESSISRLMRDTGLDTDIAALVKWRGKKAVFVGDSITAGTGTTSGHVYYNYLNNMIGFSQVVPMGVAGSCYSVTSDYGAQHSPIASRASTVPTDADLVVIFAGTNDWGHNTPLGTIADTTDISFYGALYVTLSTIISANPGVRLVMMTPLHRYGFGTYADDMGPNGQGLTLADYVDAIKAMAARFGVPVIDTYSTSGLCPYIEQIKTDYVPDGLHPNEAGHELLADRVHMWLGLM